MEDLLISVCDECWKALKGERPPHRVPNPEPTTCSECGRETTSGIYIALHPDVDAAE